jgi:hypothetical protein
VAQVASPLRLSVGAGLVETRVSVSDALDGSAPAVTLPREAPAESLAASETTSPATADVRGLAAAECLTPGRTAWLVGGATTVGRTTWIVVTNAGTVNATIDLAVWGAAGPIDAPGTSGIIVAAGSQRVLSLAGIAVNEPSPVVAVTSTGGSVVATLQTTVVRGLDASGISIVTPVTAPATRNVIPALPVVGGQAVLERATPDGGIDALTALRLLAPGDADTEVTVTLLPEEGGQGLALTTTLSAGVVFDLPFTDLLDGEYSVLLDSTEPIVVSARSSIAGQRGLDLEWFTAAAALEPGSDVLAAIAPTRDGATARLHFFAPEAEATVTLDGRVVVVAAGRTVVLTSASNVAVRLTTSALLHASVSYRGDGQLAGLRIQPPPSATAPVTVFAY